MACKTNPGNQSEYQKLMKYVEDDVKGRTVCQDCGCEYVTRWVTKFWWLLQLLLLKWFQN